MLTETERAVLAHVVIDPDAWLANAVAELGEDRARAALDAKVARWKPDYEKAKARLGDAYQTRAQSEPEE